MVFQYMALNKVFDPKRKEVTEERRKLHGQWLYAWYSVLNMTRMIKSSRIRWAGYVALTEPSRIVYSALTRKSEDKAYMAR